MRNGSGILHGVATTPALHVVDLDEHLRSVRAANAELREQIAAVRARVAEVEQARSRQRELARSLGSRLLDLEAELLHERRDADGHLDAVAAAAAEEAERVLGSARIQAARLQQALASVVGQAEFAAVVHLTPRSVASTEPGDATTERSVAG